MDPGHVQACNTLQRHRGPDDEGYLLGRIGGGEFRHASGEDTDRRLDLPTICSLEGGFDLVLAHRRLSILDLSTAGHQPMLDPSGQVAVVFNGEIYNYQELREELKALGHAFGTACDTEVLLAAYREWGVACFSRFVGMWSLALWDRSRQELVCARDPFGIKPFYYHHAGSRFAFASEIKALLALSGARRTLNPQRTFLYLRWGQTDFGDETLFSEIAQLPPGHVLVLPLDGRSGEKVTAYWRPSINESPALSFEDAAQRLRELFLESVGFHMRSDVPIGTALSGGVDSSAISCSMREIGGPELNLHTFSYLADDPHISEKAWIDLVNGRTKATSHPARVAGEDLREDLDNLIYQQDEPFGSTRIYAQYRVYREARRAGVTVLLNGQGADELLGGYHYYFGARWASLMRQDQWLRGLRFLNRTGRLKGWSSWSTMKFGAQQLLPGPTQPMLRLAANRRLVPDWLNREWFDRQGVEFSGLGAEGGPDCLKQALAHTLSTVSLPHLLRYEDRNSMAFSIESRVPFLTTRLADFVLSLPESYIISDEARTKSVFVAAMRGLVPDHVLDRKDKVGFETPEGDWMPWLREWGEDVLAPGYLADMPMFRAVTLGQALGGSMSGHSAWRCLCFLKWCKRFEVTGAS
ncbi:MAG: asparagine synthase (glutamine-hydrolyzing) [Holophagaceae bacterium]|nr:asparagine synthase (glutamine-hydrolyzing) [Holophagaceae bacterium]